MLSLSQLPKPRCLQIRCNGRVQLCAFGLLFPQLRHQPLHLVLERLAVVLLRFRADVTTGGQHIAVLAHLCQGGAFAEAGDVGVGVDTLTLALGTLTPERGSPRPSPFKGEG